MDIQDLSIEQLRRVVCNLRNKLKAYEDNAPGVISAPGAYPVALDSDADAFRSFIFNPVGAVVLQIVPANPNRRYLSIYGINPVGKFPFPDGAAPLTDTQGDLNRNLTIEYWYYRNPVLTTSAWFWDNTSAAAFQVYVYEEYKTG